MTNNANRVREKMNAVITKTELYVKSHQATLFRFNTRCKLRANKCYIREYSSIIIGPTAVVA